MVVTVILYLASLDFPRSILGLNSVSQGLRSSFYKQVPMSSSKLHTLGKWMGINYKLLININADRPKAVLKYNSAMRKPHKVRESGSYLLKIRQSQIDAVVTQMCLDRFPKALSKLHWSIFLIQLQTSLTVPLFCTAFCVMVSKTSWEI